VLVSKCVRRVRSCDDYVFTAYAVSLRPILRLHDVHLNV
jgi:hypothetical protein